MRAANSETNTLVSKKLSERGPLLAELHGQVLHLEGID